MLRRVYVEANSLRGRWPEVVGELRVLATLGQTVRVEVCIPDSAILEYKHSAVRERSESLEKAAREIETANLLLRGVARHVEIPAQPATQAIYNAYDEATTRAIVQYGLVRVPLTRRTVADFVRFAAERVPPFKKEDAGFRDSVHLNSIIEDLQARPLAHGDHAVLITADRRIASADVGQLSRRAGISLEVAATFRDVAAQLVAQLADATRETVTRYGTVWRPFLLADANNRLKPAVLRNLLRTPIVRGIAMDVITASEMRWEDPPLIIPLTGDSPNVYHASYELLLAVRGFSLSANTASPIGLDLTQRSPTLLLSVEAQVRIDGGDIRLTYEECYAFAVYWTRRTEDMENLPDRLELLKEPL